jgi:hypothetical protein
MACAPRKFEIIREFCTAEDAEEARRLRELQVRLHEKAGTYIGLAVTGLASAFSAEDQLVTFEDRAAAAQAEAASRHMLAASLRAESSMESSKAIHSHPSTTRISTRG